MKITRRTFNLGIGAVGATPLLATIPISSTFIGSNSLSLVPEQTTYGADATTVALKIDGWDARANDRTADGGEVWINVNSSWRGAWR